MPKLTSAPPERPGAGLAAFDSRAGNLPWDDHGCLGTAPARALHRFGAWVLASATWLAAFGSPPPSDGSGRPEPEPGTVPVYAANRPPLTPQLEELPLLTQVHKDGITWTFSSPQRIGRFVNGDYYVVGPATIVDIQPRPTPSNERHGSMLNIQPNLQRSGFDGRLEGGRYDPSLRVYPPLTLTPGNKLVSSRSAESNLTAVLRPFDISVSPVASISILTSVAAPQSPDAFRPSYARGSTHIYESRNLDRQLLPMLRPVEHIPPLSEFEGYLRRPWVDSVFFNFDVPAEYMASYGRENAYLISYAGLLLTLDLPWERKEPLLVYLTQYGIDLFGLVEQGHPGWQAFGGHGSGRKFPILLAGLLLHEPKMTSVQAQFGEDMHTIWVEETPPRGTYTRSWHRTPAQVVYAGHLGVDGEADQPGWGPYEHLPPSAWKNTIGESYRRCCTSVSWVGEALAARLIPGLEAIWNHPPFFAYVDRWMFSPDDPQDLEAIRRATGWEIVPDFYQGQSWKILSGGGYYAAHRTFIDEMWSAYRLSPVVSAPSLREDGAFQFTMGNLTPNRTNFVQLKTNVAGLAWETIGAVVPATNSFLFIDSAPRDAAQRFYRVEAAR